MTLYTVESTEELAKNSDKTMKEAILDIYEDMSEDEIAVLKDLMIMMDVSNLVALLVNDFEDDVLDSN